MEVGFGPSLLRRCQLLDENAATDLMAVLSPQRNLI
jgi:hypothetical protein